MFNAFFLLFSATRAAEITIPCFSFADFGTETMCGSARITSNFVVKYVFIILIKVHFYFVYLYVHCLQSVWVV